MKRISYLVLALTLVLAVSGVRPVAARQSAAAAAPDLGAQLAEVEKAIDTKRTELGIPGAALVIVKDDKIIYMKGLGLRDVERKLPVTPDTLFAIGSSTKAFTGMAAVMAADDGKLSLDDSPKKYLPYFSLQDPEADAKITIRDLLCHRSGLNRTDIAWYSGALTREEIVKVAGMAKPTAKLGEKFQYQNVMFLAAGEALARAERTTYEKFVESRILKPLGMKSTTLSIKQMQKSKDYSLGYAYNFATKETRNLPTRDLTAIAPAGAINSSARDMAQWVRFMLDGGVFNGKRLVSEAGFAEVVKPQMKVGGTIDYGFGWFLRDWNGHKVVEHGGNIDGFNAQVALMPDQKLGFVLLTNVSASPLGDFAMQTIWSKLVGDPNAMAAASGETVDPKTEVGVYAFPQAGFDVTITYEGDHLVANVPGQPKYALENVGGRRYKLGAPAPAGFFATFRPVKDNSSMTEMYLEQPQGNFVLPKKVTEEVKSPVPEALAELMGSYTDASGKATIEIANLSGKVSMVVPGQPAYPLVEKAKDAYALGGLPDSYQVEFHRGQDGKVSGFVIKQPQGNFEFSRSTAQPVADITVEDLQARAVKALGGEEALRKHTSMTTDIEVDIVNQGVTGVGKTYAKAPAMAASDITIMALGKPLGTIHDYFDGTAGGEQVSFATSEVYAGKRLADVRVSADFYEPLNWKTLYKEVKITGKQKVGDEEAYVVVKTPENGNPVTDYYSTNSFRLIRRDTVTWSETLNTGIPSTTLYKDYRNVGGLVVPFEVETDSVAQGAIVTRVKKATLDLPIPESVFKAK